MELDVLAKLRASVVREKYSFLNEEDARGPLPLVLWMNSGPSFTGGACEFNARCRSSSGKHARKRWRERLARKWVGELRGGAKNRLELS